MILGITGPRPAKFGNDYDLVSPGIARLKKLLISIVHQEKPTATMCGMALGIDTLFALVSMELDIPLIAAVPFIGQESQWPHKSIDLYKKILAWEKTTLVVVCSGGYAGWKMQKRNMYIGDHCNKLIGVSDGSPGGTFNCIKYAKSINRQIIPVNLNEFK
jgi:uncharacterized phage-like protein YoqJ